MYSLVEVGRTLSKLAVSLDSQQRVEDAASSALVDPGTLRGRPLCATSRTEPPLSSIRPETWAQGVVFHIPVNLAMESTCTERAQNQFGLAHSGRSKKTIRFSLIEIRGYWQSMDLWAGWITDEIAGHLLLRRELNHLCNS